MYFPAGAWHCVETLEPGMSLNISLMGSTYAEVYTQALHHLLLKDDSWRRVILDDLHNSKTAASHLQALIDNNLSGKIEELKSSMIFTPLATERLDIVVDANSSDDGEGGWVEEEGFEECENDDDEEQAEGEGEVEEEEEEEEEEEDRFFLPRQVFDIESPCEFKCVRAASKLEANPLTLVLNEEEVTNYYRMLEPQGGVKSKRREGKQQKDGKAEGLFAKYIVNSNYAGNDMHSPTSRFIVTCCKNSAADKAMDSLKRQKQKICAESVTSDTLDWLVFLGILV